MDYLKILNSAEKFREEIRSYNKWLMIVPSENNVVRKKKAVKENIVADNILKRQRRQGIFIYGKSFQNLRHYTHWTHMLVVSEKPKASCQRINSST